MMDSHMTNFYCKYAFFIFISKCFKFQISKRCMMYMETLFKV